MGGGEPISCRKGGEGESERELSEGDEEKRKARGLSSYRRRIELRFLSNSEDRTNLKGAGSRR